MDFFFRVGGDFLVCHVRWEPSCLVLCGPRWAQQNCPFRFSHPWLLGFNVQQISHFLTELPLLPVLLSRSACFVVCLRSVSFKRWAPKLHNLFDPRRSGHFHRCEANTNKYWFWCGIQEIKLSHVATYKTFVYLVSIQLPVISLHRTSWKTAAPSTYVTLNFFKSWF